MRLEDLNWMDVEHYLQTDDRLIFIIGACEQHGYLSLLTDIRIPQAIADAASAQTNVLIAPPLNFGISPYFQKYPGTISLRTQTFLAVIDDMVRWVHGQGFRKLLFLNGHGGNNPATGILNELVNDLPGLEVDWYSWWVAESVQAVARNAGLTANHANWLEAFPFCRVADLPTEVKPPTPPARAILNADDSKALYGDGVFGGGPYMADDSIMQGLFDAAVSDTVKKLKFGE
jgi:creatinine amidohydrolase